MITPELIERINALANKKKSTGLTANETAEQADLRRKYLDHITDQLKATLEQIEIVDDVNEADAARATAKKTLPSKLRH